MFYDLTWTLRGDVEILFKTHKMIKMLSYAIKIKRYQNKHPALHADLGCPFTVSSEFCLNREKHFLII